MNHDGLTQPGKGSGPIPVAPQSKVPIFVSPDVLQPGMKTEAQMARKIPPPFVGVD